MAVTFKPSEPLNNFLNEISAIGSKGQYNEPMKLPDPPKPKPLGAFSGLGGYVPPGGSSIGSGGLTGGMKDVPGDLGRLMRAIRSQESGGRYQATNPSGAIGAYQILWQNMAGNRGWDYEALGRNVSRSEFLNSPGLQDAIASYKLGKYLKSRGMAGAAATWYGGDWGYRNMYNKRPQAGYPSMYDYVMSVINRA